MSGEQRAMLAQLQQQQAPYPSQGNPILGLQIPSLQRFAEQNPGLAPSPYVLPFYRQHLAPYDWSKMFGAATAPPPGPPAQKMRTDPPSEWIRQQGN